MPIQDQAWKFRVPLDRDIPQDYIEYEKERIEKNALWSAVKQFANGGWICVKLEWREVCDYCAPLYAEILYDFYVHVREVKTPVVYIPIYSSMQMPKDVYHCKFCGGMTKNDIRGHCLACGGPRNRNYLDGVFGYGD